MRTFPISPALSACDSLADIDDLYAFLEAQGELSRFPTPPPPKEDFMFEEIETDLEAEEAELDAAHAARIFADEANIGTIPTHTDMDLIQQILIRARLPTEMLALAYNILTALDCRSIPEGSFYSAPGDLMVVSCMSLAVSYTNDRPADSSFWSNYVCDCMWTGIRIHKTALMILEALDWRIHPLTAPERLEKAMDDLRRSRVSLDGIEVQTRRDSLLDTQQAGLDYPWKLEVATYYTPKRQLTPEQSPAACDDLGHHCGLEAR